MIGLEYRLENPTGAHPRVRLLLQRPQLPGEGEGRAGGALGPRRVRALGRARRGEALGGGQLLRARWTRTAARVNHAWFRGGWLDALTMAWKDVEEGACYDRAPVSEGEPGARGEPVRPRHARARGGADDRRAALVVRGRRARCASTATASPTPTSPATGPGTRSASPTSTSWPTTGAPTTPSCARRRPASPTASTTRPCPPRSSRRSPPT